MLIHKFVKAHRSSFNHIVTSYGSCCGKVTEKFAKSINLYHIIGCKTLKSFKTSFLFFFVCSFHKARLIFVEQQKKQLGNKIKFPTF